MPKIATTIRNATEGDRKIWSTHVKHPMQSWEWGEFRKAMGVRTERWIVEKNNTIDACWQVTFHSIPHTPWTVGYFPKGPKPDTFMIRELKRIGQTQHAISIQIEPLVEAADAHIPTDHSLRSSKHPLFTKYTFLLDLSPSEAELLGSMHPKTRYNIRVAEKHGVIVQEDNSEKAFEEYLRLNAETTERQGFYAHNEQYHRTMWALMRKSGIAHLFTATYHGETLAAWIIFGWNKTAYYPYGTSSRNHREVMAPTLLLWEIARWAKRNGYTTFDLWGALSAHPDIKDPWYGFHRFKQGFSPRHVEYVGSYDIVVSPILHATYNIANSLRWAILHLKK